MHILIIGTPSFSLIPSTTPRGRRRNIKIFSACQITKRTEYKVWKIRPVKIIFSNSFVKGVMVTIMLEALKNARRKYNVYDIPLSCIKPNPSQPRKIFETSALKELSESIKEYGVLQPITVRKVRCGYELISGERRLRASQLAGMHTIPALIINADKDKSAILALLENLQREDLSFFEIAEGYQRLINEQGMTQEDIAKKLGKSQSTIANKIRLLKLSPIVKKIIREYSLTERHARTLLNLDSEKQLEAARIICDNNLNVRQSEELVSKMLKDKVKKHQTVKIPGLKDMRLFTNTVKQAVNLMRENGVDANMEQNDFDWGIEYIIKVIK